MYSSLLEIILLVTAVSVDAFGAGFAYGVHRIRVPWVSVIIIAGMSGLTLVFSLLAGNVIGSLIPERLTRYFSFLLLFILGLVKLFDRSGHHEAEEANKDQDDLVSPAEALTLGIALSVDCIAAGIGAGIPGAEIPGTFILSFFIGAIAVWSGSGLGHLIAVRCRSNLCWVSGCLLLLLAFMKLL
jgi:putative Mn2+ efflux pump MntP